MSGECQGWIFSPEKQGMVATHHEQHKFDLTTRRCVHCNLHELHLASGAACVALPEPRRVVDGDMIITGPDA